MPSHGIHYPDAPLFPLFLTLKIPQEKLQEIQNICLQFAFKWRVTKNQLQSLLGSLLHITKCIRPALFFSQQNASVAKG